MTPDTELLQIRFVTAEFEVNLPKHIRTIRYNYWHWHCRELTSPNLSATKVSDPLRIYTTFTV